jgi:hypothetical protein
MYTGKSVLFFGYHFLCSKCAGGRSGVRHSPYQPQRGLCCCTITKTKMKTLRWKCWLLATHWRASSRIKVRVSWIVILPSSVSMHGMRAWPAADSDTPS